MYPRTAASVTDQVTGTHNAGIFSEFIFAYSVTAAVCAFSVNAGKAVIFSLVKAKAAGTCVLTVCKYHTCHDDRRRNYYSDYLSYFHLLLSSVKIYHLFYISVRVCLKQILLFIKSYVCTEGSVLTVGIGAFAVAYAIGVFRDTCSTAIRTFAVSIFSLLIFRFYLHSDILYDPMHLTVRLLISLIVCLFYHTVFTFLQFFSGTVLLGDDEHSTYFRIPLFQQSSRSCITIIYYFYLNKTQI